MEELLRTYYANLNPQATEEEILAYLQSQGIDMSAPQGIASLAPRVMPESSDYTNVIGRDPVSRPTGGIDVLGAYMKPESFLDYASLITMPTLYAASRAGEYAMDRARQQRLGAQPSSDDGFDSSDTTASGGPQSMGSAQGGAGGRPY